MNALRPKVSPLLPACLAVFAWTAIAQGCASERRELAQAPVYEPDVAPLLRERCTQCHGAERASGGFRTDGYLHTIACIGGQSAVEPPDTRAPLLRALDHDAHSGVLSGREATLLASWVAAGAPLRSHGVHAPGILDPRSGDWHGTLARGDRWAVLLDADHPQACGRCHAGAPAPRESLRHPAPGATACTQCHERQQGVLACGTCHGDADRAYPPRGSCLLPLSGGAHAAHVQDSPLTPSPLACSDCHPAADASLTGEHGNGSVDVRFALERAGPTAQYTADNGTCSVSCHDRGGARARPTWWDAQGRYGCSDCHRSPPTAHYPGACTGCHAGANADGSALLSRDVHLNGQLDLGSGGQACGACHGDGGDDPWPDTPSHRVHRDSALTRAIECGDCHEVPDTVTSAGHLDASPVELSFSARAGGASAHYEAGTCSAIACHGASSLAEPRAAPAWDTAATGECTVCHGVPPANEHPVQNNCASLLCHGGEVSISGDVPHITRAGRARHIDGVVDVASP